MARNAGCCCWLCCLLIILFQTRLKHKRVVNSTPKTRPIQYPKVLICFKGLREGRLSATVLWKSDPEITSRCFLKAFSISYCRSWISTDILLWFNRHCLTLSQLNCVFYFWKLLHKRKYSSNHILVSPVFVNWLIDLLMK